MMHVTFAVNVTVEGTYTETKLEDSCVNINSNFILMEKISTQEQKKNVFEQRALHACSAPSVTHSVDRYFDRAQKL